MAKFKDLNTGEVVDVVIVNGKPVATGIEKGIVKTVSKGGKQIGQLGDVEKAEGIEPAILASEFVPLCKQGVELLIEVCKPEKPKAKAKKSK